MTGSIRSQKKGSSVVQWQQQSLEFVFENDVCLLLFIAIFVCLNPLLTPKVNVYVSETRSSKKFSAKLKADFI